MHIYNSNKIYSTFHLESESDPGTTGFLQGVYRFFFLVFKNKIMGLKKFLKLNNKVTPINSIFFNYDIWVIYLSFWSSSHILNLLLIRF